jgi:predicted O-methyltransferase YrrM
MTGTISTKIARLLTHLVIQPQYLVPYVATNVVRPRLPLQLELPWISYAAIDFLAAFAANQMSVFEYGSGGSTLFFARRAAAVISVEDNPLWLERVRQRIEQLGLTNVDLRHKPYHFGSVVNFETSEYLNSIPNEKFDIIFVDGTEQEAEVRPQCFYHAENFVRPGGIIVVDDSWRYESLRTTNRARSVRVFQGVGPARPGVTSTDVFFY